MEALGVGSLPVCAGRRLVGAITDRDIVIRGVAAGLSPIDGLVSDCMTAKQSLMPSATRRPTRCWSGWKTLQVRRLAVLDRDKMLAGIVSLGDIATEPRARGARHRRRGGGRNLASRRGP